VVDLEGPGLDHGILGFSVFHLNLHVSHFLLNVTFLCKFRRIRVLECALEFMSALFLSSEHFLCNSVTLAILVKTVDSGCPG